MPLKSRQKLLPPGYSDKQITKLRPHRLQKLLRRTKVTFSKKAEQEELQALWTLFRMGLINQAEELLEKTTRFWSLTVVKQVQQLRKLDPNLKIGGNKLDHVVAYVDTLAADIEDDIRDPDSDEENQPVNGKGKQKAADDSLGSEELQTVDDDDSSVPLPQPELVNFLVAFIFTGVTQNKDLAGLPHYPAKSIPALKQHLNALPAFETEQDLRDVLQDHGSSEVLKWICDEFKDMFSIPTDEQKVPGLPDTVPQFIINQHPADRVATFQRSFAKAGSNSMLIFHGTNLDSVMPILKTGFRGEVWMAEEPRVSYGYTQVHRQASVLPNMLNNPYTNFGALLGCEVAGNGKVISNWDGPIHARVDPKTIMPRYVFLIPAEHVGSQKDMPRRTDMEKTILAGFEDLRSRDEEESQAN